MSCFDAPIFCVVGAQKTGEALGKGYEEVDFFCPMQPAMGACCESLVGSHSIFSPLPKNCLTVRLYCNHGGMRHFPVGGVEGRLPVC